ncbi:1-acyl-sn-glycerol-3-phosphate acyltransferase [Leptolyngbya sp. FACHB-261]|uniref:1-acyl-sn-glycerol-3-phosphate acyltransferase n=1 Tax=Leptolyngbya sp. FACHB-261 TaxID=2692806 RepID=UPI0016882C43|nr:1-acyl-sn-glycerol-3-phosphate acyltransferase [Leptolyngbya sp. FACHB-261]MBD2103436.1 1-acyl-sn-glycerol-3-phosphate acyltransferase [Leptolyngbya sp. FACHB-261]
MTDFYPPRLDPLFVRLCQSVAPWLGHWQYRMDLQVDQACLDRLNHVRDHRLLLLPNHPTYHDWIAVFLLSARVGEVFHYMAAHERFKGSEGRFLQRMGAYSIKRGLADRTSVAYTMELLMQPACRLVIFPEGGCSFQNDTVMPFRAGAVQIALQAMSKLVKRGEPLPDLYTVPISLKYRYTSDMGQAIHNTLSRLEQALQITPTGSEFYLRLRAVAERVMVSFECDYDLHSVGIEHLSWNQRIPRIKQHVLEACEQKLGLVTAANEPMRERVYKLQHVLEAEAETLGAQDAWTYESIHKAAARLLNFDAIYDGYVAAAPTPERFLDTLVRLEREVFAIGQPVPKGHRKVIIHIGEPINLKDHFQQYQKNKSSTVNAIVQQLQQTVQHNLEVGLKANC